jgi:hypothetical protein
MQVGVTNMSRYHNNLFIYHNNNLLLSHIQIQKQTRQNYNIELII